MNKDNVIDSKVKDLKDLQSEIQEKLDTLPKFITNMKVESSNLRTVGNVDELRKMFHVIYEKNLANNAFDRIIAEDTTKEHLIEGYTYDQWVQDFQTLYKKLTYNQKLTQIQTSIKALENYYTEDKRVEQKFNSLLDDVEKLFKD